MMVVTPLYAALLALWLLVLSLRVIQQRRAARVSLGAGGNTRLERALYGMLGAMLSDLILIAAVSVGLGAVLAASETAFATVKWIGVVYLVYLGIQLLRTKPQPQLNGLGRSNHIRPHSSRIFIKCLLVALTNPKGYLFFSAILPQFVNPQAPQYPQYLILALTFAAVDGLVMFGYAGGGARAVQLFRVPMAVCWINRLSGGLLITLAGALALYRRAQK